MSTETTYVGRPLITGTAVLMVALAIAAWSSNPDEAHFRRWIGRQVQGQSESISGKIAGRVLPQIALAVVDWERTDYGFCSVVVVHEPVCIAFVGAFGTWWQLPPPGAADQSSET